MTRQRGLHGDPAGLEVPDLTDHDDVRILPEESSESGSEGHPDLGAHLHLVDAVQVVLDRIFGRHDIDFVRVDAAESAVQSRSLT